MSSNSPEVGAMDLHGFCRWAGVSLATTYREIKAGRLKLRKVGRKSIILTEDARAWLQALPEGTASEAA